MKISAVSIPQYNVSHDGKQNKSRYFASDYEFSTVSGKCLYAYNNINFCGVKEKFERENEVRKFRQLIKADEGFSPDEIHRIISGVNTTNICHAQIMYSDKNFPNELIDGILQNISEANADVAMEMILDKEFDNNTICSILYYINETEGGLSFVEKVLKNKSLSAKELYSVMFALNDRNIELADKLANDSDFPKNEISNCIANIKKEDADARIEFFNLVKEHKGELKDKYEKALDAIGVINSYNVELARDILLNKNFPKDKLREVLASTSRTNAKDRVYLHNYLENIKDDFGKSYPETLYCALKSSDARNNSSKINLYKYIKSIEKNSDYSQALYGNIFKKATNANENCISYIYDTSRSNAKKFASDYRDVVIKMLEFISGDLKKDRDTIYALNNYVSNERYNENGILRQVIGEVLSDDTDMNKTSMMDYILKAHYNEALVSELKENKYDVCFEHIQNKNDIEMVFKSLKKVNKGPKEPCEIKRFVRLKPNGEVLKSQQDAYLLSKNYVLFKTSTDKGDYVCDSYYKIDRNYGGILQEEVRVLKNSDDNFRVEHTKASDIMEGVFDITTYDFKAQEKDKEKIINDVRCGRAKGREISKTYRNEYGVIHVDNFNYGDVNTKRISQLRADGKQTKLDYQITDKYGRKILDIRRAFEFGRNASTTIVNGKKYYTHFDDKNHIATIQSDNGSDAIDFGKKMMIFTQEQEDMIWNLIKKTPADMLLELRDVEVLSYEKANGTFVCSDRIKIYTDDNLGALSHEIGHFRDFTGAGRYKTSELIRNRKEGDSIEYKISSNPKLIEIYNEEIENLKNNISEGELINIKYFSQVGGGKSGTGLCELVAETNTLCTMHSPNNLETRAFYLLKYFPKTIAKAAELLGY